MQRNSFPSRHHQNCPTPYSLLPTPYSLLPTPHTLPPTLRSLRLQLVDGTLHWQGTQIALGTVPHAHGSVFRVGRPDNEQVRNQLMPGFANLGTQFLATVIAGMKCKDDIDESALADFLAIENN